MLREGHLTFYLIKRCHGFIFSNKHVPFGHCKAPTSGILPWALKLSQRRGVTVRTLRRQAAPYLFWHSWCFLHSAYDSDSGVKEMKKEEEGEKEGRGSVW